MYLLDTYTDKKSFLMNTFKFFFTRRKLREAFQDEHFDFIYCSIYTYWTTLINAMFPHIPVYATIHDPILHSGESAFNRFMKFVWDRDACHAEKIIVLSQRFQKECMRRYHKAKQDVLVVPHGVFTMYRTENPQYHIDYPKDKVNFVFFGRIERYKGVGVLLEAYHQLEQRYAGQMTLTIAGNGDMAPYAESLAVCQDVRVVNRWIENEEIASFFTGPNIVAALPYLDASQSGVANIAMLHDDLVIATQTGGLPEQLGDGRYGVLAAPGDVAALAEVMGRIIEEPHAFDDQRKAAQVHIKDLDWKNLAKIILDAMRMDKEKTK